MFVFTVFLLGVLHSAAANPICDADTALEAKAQCAIITGSPVPGLVEHPALHFEESGYIDSRYNAKTLDDSSFADIFAFPEQVETGLHAIRGTSKMNFPVTVDTMDGYIRSEPEKSARLRKRRHLPEGCQDIMEQDKSLVATVKRVDIAWGAVGLIPGLKDPVTLSAVVEFSGDSPDVRGAGLWKLSMYGSNNADGTGDQFQRADQLLSNDQQTMALTDGEFINFGLIRGEIDVTGIGCEKDFRYLCFDFMKGDHATPDFSFTSSQLNRLKTPDTKWTNCSNRCEQIQGTAVARGMQINSDVETQDVNPGEKSPLTADVTVMFSQASDDISGTGLWKFSIYGSKTENGLGEKFQPTDQLLSDAHQAQPLTNGGNITFHDIRGYFDLTGVGCGEAFRYVCFDFTKGGHSSIDFTFVFAKNGGSSKLTYCSDRCPPVDEGSAVLDHLSVSYRAANVTQGKKDDLTINVTATFAEASADVIGTGLWKLSMYGSNNRDGNGEQFQRVDQILSVNQQSQPLLESRELVFVNAKGEIDIVAVGCDMDFKYMCFELTKGENPNPDFHFASFQEDTTRHALCSNRCKHRRGEAVVRSLSVRWTATGVKPSQKDPFSMNATIGFSEATDYVSGTGLWKLSLYGSPNADGTGEQFQRMDQMLTLEHQSQQLAEGTREAMVFYDVQGELDILAIGCGKKFRYVCFDFSQGDSPEPNFMFASLQEDSTKLTLCSDRCEPSADLNVDNGFILVTDLAGAIRAAPLDGESGVFSFQDIPVPNIHAPVAIDFDPVHQKIYFTDVVSKTINRCNLDGSVREVVIDLPTEATPDGLTLSTNERVLYWTDASLQRIEKADLNGGNREVILNSPKPRAIVVDPNNERLYWTDWGTQPKIEKANTDGTNRNTLIDSGLQWPNGLAVDFADERMYWCDAGANKIESADLDGMNRITHLSTGTTLDIHPYDIGIYQGNILWSDWAFKQLLQIGTAPNSQPGFVGQSVFTRGGGLHIQPGTRRSRRDVSLGGIFTKCHDVIDPDEFFNDCTRNWCSAQSYPQLCDDIAAYADACESHGVFIGDWRDSVGCDV